MRDRGAHCDEMSEAECDAIEDLGYTPTINFFNREVKNRDGRYMNADQLRVLSSALVKLADYLDRRAI